MGNVISTATTLTRGTDNQAFCYDEQNRLTWASAATGTPPCGGSLTSGSLTSAQYTASYSYDTLGRLTSAPLGAYTYGDPSHQDAATAVGSTYSASYDAAGDMTCRAPSSNVTCSGTPTGNALTYDNERRLATWQNTPSNPTSTASYWYDGEGQRVAQTLNGTTTYYVGSDEEITGSTLLKYYHIPGLPVLGTITGVTRTYLASDGLGSETVDLSYNGSVLATALYGPYGVGRYSTGTMPTSKGYTGQRQDGDSGLDYYGARYYDASVGQFTSADSVQGPNRYAYVGGNPETANDPTGDRVDLGASQSSWDAGEQALSYVIAFAQAATRARAQWYIHQESRIEAAYRDAVNDAKHAWKGGGPRFTKADRRMLRQERNAAIADAEADVQASNAAVDFIGRFGTVAAIAASAGDAVFSAIDQWNSDSGKGYDTPTRAARAFTSGAVHGAGLFAEAWGGATVGAGIGAGASAVCLAAAAACAVVFIPLGSLSGAIIATAWGSGLVNGLSNLGVNTVTTAFQAVDWANSTANNIQTQFQSDVSSAWNWLTS